MILRHESLRVVQVTGASVADWFSIRAAFFLRLRHQGERQVMRQRQRRLISVLRRVRSLLEWNLLNASAIPRSLARSLGNASSRRNEMSKRHATSQPNLPADAFQCANKFGVPLFRWSVNTFSTSQEKYRCNSNFSV